MPKFEIKARHIAFGFRLSRVTDAPSAEEIERQLVEGGFDRRYWELEIHAYATNGEDF